MKKIRKALLSLVLVLGMVVTMLYGAVPASAEEAENPMRALWLRPKQTTKAQVETVVQKIADAGINTIFLETVYDGYTIFPVEYDATYQRPMFNGFDVLQAYIDACHSRGIQGLMMERSPVVKDSQKNSKPTYRNTMWTGK